jgi:hypothetical protein
MNILTIAKMLKHNWKPLTVGLVILCFSLLSNGILTGCKPIDQAIEDDSSHIELNHEEIEAENFGIFTVSEDGMSATINGIIGDTALEDFQAMLAEFPEIDTLNFVQVDGSDISVLDNDSTDVALELGREIYRRGIKTHLVENGEISSGGTDVFAAGVETSIGSNTFIGVHAWEEGDEDNENLTAWEIRFDEDNIEHQKYLQYFEDIGFSSQKSSAFYFFTIRSAKAEDMYQMSDEEINKFLLR